MQAARITVRPARLDDADVIADIHADAWVSGFSYRLGEDVTTTAAAERCSPQRWRSLLVDGSSTAVGSLGGADCGIVQVTVDADDPTVAEVLRCYVSKSAWGTGVAHELMRWALDWCRKSGASTARVWSAGTEQAQRFYEKSGFHRTGATRVFEFSSEVRTTDYEFRMPLR